MANAMRITRLMRIPNVKPIWLVLILIGASLQNIIWYVRLKNPILMREFIMYFENDGAKLFLDFNIMNYFFLVITLTVWLIFDLINRRNKKRFAKRGKDE